MTPGGKTPVSGGPAVVSSPVLVPDVESSVGSGVPDELEVSMAAVEAAAVVDAPGPVEVAVVEPALVPVSTGGGSLKHAPASRENTARHILARTAQSTSAAFALALAGQTQAHEGSCS